MHRGRVNENSASPRAQTKKVASHCLNVTALLESYPKLKLATGGALATDF